MIALLLACTPSLPTGLPDWVDGEEQQSTVVHTEDLDVGTGDAAGEGDLVTVHYRGWLLDGTQFDTSYGRGPFSARLGRGEVIEGWDQGVRGMQPGGRRGLVLPAPWAYGENGIPGTIPPNSTLVFEIELLSVEAE